MKLNLTVLAAAGYLMLFLSGCNYHFGMTLPGKVQSIAIGDVTNETAAYNLTYELKNQLAQEFMRDGALKVADRSIADCIIFATIDSVKFTGVAGVVYDENEEVYRPLQWQVAVTVTFAVNIPGEKDLLVPKRTITAVANFEVRADVESARRNGTQMALHNAAKEIVQYTTCAW